MELFDYAFIKDYDQKFKDLSQLAATEKWSFGCSNDNKILKSYISHYFRRIYAENKIKVVANSSGKVLSIFNTGLMTNYFQEIFGVFEENKIPGKQKWHFIDFISESDPSYASLLITQKPQLANFFTKKSDIIFDIDKSIILNDIHIIEDNWDRIKHNGRSTLEVFTLITGAIEKTKKMIARNYKIAIPQFFKDKKASDGELQFLIPLYFGEISITPDAILTVKESDGYYRATTCLTKDMAYNNARLIAKPSDEWLHT